MYKHVKLYCLFCGTQSLSIMYKGKDYIERLENAKLYGSWQGHYEPTDTYLCNNCGEIFSTEYGLSKKDN